jgi:NTP pyrophosphatase (non-canonical NTP hydrolase)
MTDTIDVLSDVYNEIARAQAKHPTEMRSLHEAYAILLEEVDEFWDEVKKQTGERDSAKLRSELIQIAAMAVRTVVDLTL